MLIPFGQSMNQIRFKIHGQIQLQPFFDCPWKKFFLFLAFVAHIVLLFETKSFFDIAC